jgi:hypothetical protein
MSYSGIRYTPVDCRATVFTPVNARHTKNLPGRKSNVQESQWLLQLHTHGLYGELPPAEPCPKSPSCANTRWG